MGNLTTPVRLQLKRHPTFLFPTKEMQSSHSLLLTLQTQPTKYVSSSQIKHLYPESLYPAIQAKQDFNQGQDLHGQVPVFPTHLMLQVTTIMKLKCGSLGHYQLALLFSRVLTVIQDWNPRCK